MKVVIAIDSFKGSLNSLELSRNISEGIKNVCPQAEVISVPVADGGDGTVDALTRGMGGTIVQCSVHDPLMRPVIAKYGIIEDGKTAVIEMAEASGLTLLKDDEKDPLKASTYGTGELIKDALQKGCRNFIIGIGGSATNDLGMGMMRALGVVFKNRYGMELQGKGEDMELVDKIDTSGIIPGLKECRFTVACDVENTVYGINGAAQVYAAQKGADEAAVKKLDRGLELLSKKIKEQLGRDIAGIRGAGAAGGLGGAFVAFLDATLKSGIEIILQAQDFKKKLEGADVVITGEGRIDGQTVMGKAAVGVAKICRQKGIPVIAFAGSIPGETETLHEQGITSLFSVMNYPISLDEAMKPEVTAELIRKNTEEVFRLIRAFSIKKP